ncbi:TMR-like short-chain dehydrogenase/oxidoreductase, atypical SDR family [Lactiplantibacillus pentosus KCA1]|nr:SDR family oxidoreductase [Lactiplantibacillus pentosus]EIW12746.1 TMR-like short-chain dehydrogenase/oxidoreductase, atypical SDR family [Lactiplantibacillus pentosus KCA1]
MKYAITGATGHLGQQIVAAIKPLVDPSELYLGVHTPSKAQAYQQQGMQVMAIDYQQPERLQAFFQDSDVLIYIPSKSHDSYSRVQEFENVLAAVQQANVQHLLVMGFIADQANNPFALSAFYGYVPRRLAGTDLNYTIVRNALYADPLVPYLPELIERHNVIYPMGDQALSFISQADSAAAFAKVATTPDLLQRGRIYTLTQEQAYTMPELAAVLSQVSGQPIGYQPVSLQAFSDMYNQNNEGPMLASMYAGGAMGLLATVSDDYQQIMGQPAQSLTDFLQTTYRPS